MSLPARPKRKKNPKHGKAPSVLDLIVRRFIDVPTQEELASGGSVSDSSTLSSPENVATNGWGTTFANAFRAVDRGEEGATARLHDLARVAGAILDEVCPSTAPGALMSARANLSPLHMLKPLGTLALVDVLRWAEKLNAIYSSAHGKKSAEVRKGANQEHGWQAVIRQRALHLLSKSKMTDSNIAARLHHLAPSVELDTIRKHVGVLRRQYKVKQPTER